MTVVPRTTGTAVLICDQCGAEDSAPDVSNDSEMVWPLVAGLGWTGSPFPTGTHRCPRCSDSPPPAPRPEPVPRPGPASGPVCLIEARTDAGAVIVTPLGDLDATLTEALRRELVEAAAAYTHVLVNLRNVRFVDSAGLGLLVRAYQEARRHGGTLVLVSPSRFVVTVLHTMRLETALRTFPDQRSALEALATRP